MGSNRLTADQCWEQCWAGIRLPTGWRPASDTQAILRAILPKSDGMSFLEVGCVPGDWMVFFNKTFGYRVAGIEYTQEGARATQKNMHLQGVSGHVMQADFFDPRAVASAYDVVLSAGFVEHFADLDSVVARKCSLAKHYIVTRVPNLCGINGLIRKVMSPEVFTTHKVVTLDDLRRAHEKCGMQMLFCNYVDGLWLVPLLTSGRYRGSGRWFARGVNFPFRAFTWACVRVSRITSFWPRTVLLGRRLMYVGRRSRS